MKFNHLIFILIVLVSSFKSFATIVPEQKPAIDPLNTVLANEKLEEEDEEIGFDEHQLHEQSEGYFEKGNDPYIKDASKAEVRAGSLSAGNEELEAEDDL